MYSRHFFSLDYYFTRTNFFFFFNGLNRKFYKTGGFFTGITYYRPFNRFCISLNLGLKHEVFSFLSRYRILLDTGKGVFFDLKKFNFYIYFLSIDDSFSKSFSNRFLYSYKTYFFQFFYFFRISFFSKVFISLFFFDRFNLFFKYGKSYFGLTLTNFYNFQFLSLNRYYNNFIFLFSNLFKLVDLTFFKNFLFLEFFIFVFFSKLNSSVINLLRVFSFMFNYLMIFITYSKSVVFFPKVLIYFLSFFIFLFFYNLEVYKFLLKQIFVFFKPVLINFLYVFDDFFFFNFDHFLFKNYFNFYNAKINNLLFFLAILFKNNNSFFSNLCNIKKKSVFRRYKLPYEVFKSVQYKSSLTLHEYNKTIFFRKNNYYSLFKYFKFDNPGLFNLGGLVNVKFNFYNRLNFLAVTGLSYNSDLLINLFGKKNNLRFFLFKDFLFNFVNFVSWVLSFFNRSFFSDFYFHYVRDFNFDNLSYFFIKKFYKNLFFISNYNFDFKNVKSRISFLRLRTFFYRNVLSNFNNFVGVIRSVKSNYRFFNIFNFVDDKIKHPSDYVKYNYEVKAFNILNDKFKLSLFLNSNFNFFYKFFRVILFNRVGFFFNKSFRFKLNKRLVSYLLSKTVSFRAMYCEGNYICINLLIFDKVVLDFFYEYFFISNKSLFKNYFSSGFFFLKNNLFKFLNFSNNFLKFDSSFILKFNIKWFSNILKSGDDFYRELFRRAFEVYKVYRSYGLFSRHAESRGIAKKRLRSSFKKVKRTIGKKNFYFTVKVSEADLFNDEKYYSNNPDLLYNGIKLRHWLFWKKNVTRFYIKKRLQWSRRLGIFSRILSKVRYSRNFIPQSYRKINLVEGINGNFYDGYYSKVSKEGNFFFFSHNYNNNLLNISPITNIERLNGGAIKLVNLKELERKSLKFFNSRFYNDIYFWDSLRENKVKYKTMLSTRFKRTHYDKVFFNRDMLLKFAYTNYFWRRSKFNIFRKLFFNKLSHNGRFMFFYYLRRSKMDDSIPFLKDSFINKLKTLRKNKSLSSFSSLSSLFSNLSSFSSLSPRSPLPSFSKKKSKLFLNFFGKFNNKFDNNLLSYKEYRGLRFINKLTSNRFNSVRGFHFDMNFFSHKNRSLFADLFSKNKFKFNNRTFDKRESYFKNKNVVSVFGNNKFLIKNDKVSKRRGYRRDKDSDRMIYYLKLNAGFNTDKRLQKPLITKFVTRSIWREENWFINFSRRRTTFPEFYEYTDRLLTSFLPNHRFLLFPLFYKFFILRNQFDYNYFYSMTHHWRKYNVRILNFFGRFDHYYAGLDNPLLKRFMVRGHEGGLSKVAVQAKFYKLFEPRWDFGWSRYSKVFRFFYENYNFTICNNKLTYYFTVDGKKKKIKPWIKLKFIRLLNYYNYFYNYNFDFYLRFKLDFESYFFSSFPNSSLFSFKIPFLNNYFYSSSRTFFFLNSFLSLLTLVNSSFILNKNDSFYLRYKFLSNMFFGVRNVSVFKYKSRSLYYFKKPYIRSMSFSALLRFFFSNRQVIQGLKKYYFTKYRFCNKRRTDFLGFINLNIFNNFNFSSNRFSLYRGNLLSVYYYLVKFKHLEKRTKKIWSRFQVGTGQYDLNSISNDFYFISNLFNNTYTSFSIKYPSFFYRFWGMSKFVKFLFNSRYRFVKVRKRFRFDSYFAEGFMNKIIDKNYVNYLKLVGNLDFNNLYFIMDYFFIWLIVFYRKVSFFIFNKMYFFFVLIFLVYMQSNFSSCLLDDYNKTNFVNLDNIYSDKTDSRYLINSTIDFGIKPLEQIFLSSPELRLRVDRVRYLPQSKSFFMYSFSNVYIYNPKLDI